LAYVVVQLSSGFSGAQMLCPSGANGQSSSTSAAAPSESTPGLTAEAMLSTALGTELAPASPGAAASGDADEVASSRTSFEAASAAQPGMPRAHTQSETSPALIVLLVVMSDSSVSCAVGGQGVHRCRVNTRAQQGLRALIHTSDG
jgi:hypothetical protein